MSRKLAVSHQPSALSRHPSAVSRQPIRWSLRLAPFLISAFSLGCSQKLDREWHNVNEKFRDGNRTFAAVTRAYAQAAGDMADKKHALQERHVERDWQDFVRIHTNASGRLVSLDDKGQEVPLLAADLEAALTARRAKEEQVAASRASWASVHAPFLDAVGRFEAMTEATGGTEAKIIAAKESAQAFVESVLKVVGGVVAGAGIGVAAAP